MVQDYYDAIVEGFFASTGKRIGRPELSGDGQIAIFVDAGSGNRHTLSRLSSGEQEALGLMYFVRRLAAQGGVLMIDEPEQHLHPSLQRSIVSLLRQEGQFSQLWLSTHSPGLITSTNTSSLLIVAAPTSSAMNQLQRLQEEPEKVDLLADLGIPPTLWQHGDYLVVVEGSTDERILNALLPGEMSRALVLVAGDSRGVDRVAEALSGRPGVLPWIGIKDRDLRTDSEVVSASEQSGNVIIWPRRAIENLFLDPAWLYATLRRAGAGAKWDETSLTKHLAELAAEQREDIVRILVERKMDRDYPPSSSSRKDLVAWYEGLEEAFHKRRGAYEDVLRTVTASVEQQWDVRWAEWVQGKRLLAEFLQATPFRTVANLQEAMIAMATEDERYMPEAVKSVRQRIRSL